MAEYIHSLPNHAARAELVAELKRYPIDMLLEAMNGNPSFRANEYTDKAMYKIKELAVLRDSRPDFWAEDEARFSMLPIRHSDIMKEYNEQKACFWPPSDVTFANDDYASLSPELKRLVKYIMGFFNVSDALVNENILTNLVNHMPAQEAKCMYIFQMAQENIHAEVYGRMIDAYITDPEEKRAMFEDAHDMRAVKMKVDWVKKWLTESSGIAQCLAAFAVVECQMFPVIFAMIWWMKSENLPLEGFFFSNEFIARDEGNHGDAGTLMYRDYIPAEAKLSERDIRDMVNGAVESDAEFIREALNGCTFPGLTADMLVQYSRFLGDQTLKQLGYGPVYNEDNPFRFMNGLGVSGRTDFFTKRVSEYRFDSTDGADAPLEIIDEDL
jgi:ribonucleoside-diphosphate reductase beta chain